MIHSGHALPPGAQQPDFKLLWVSCGTDDTFFAANQQLITELKDKHISVTAVKQGEDTHGWSGTTISFISPPCCFRRNSLMSHG